MQAAYLDKKSEGEVDVALLTRRTNAPREVELNSLWIGDIQRPVKQQHSWSARNTLKLYVVSAVFFVLRHR